jgi:hypothetical protein
LADYLVGNSWPHKSGSESFSGGVCGRGSRSRAYREVISVCAGKIMPAIIDKRDKVELIVNIKDAIIEKNFIKHMGLMENI